MNRLFSSFISVLSATIISVNAFTFTDVNAEENEEVTVTFNCFTDDITFDSKTNIDNFQSYSTNSGYAIIPQGTLKKTGYKFNGWTIDGIYAYTAGNVYNFPEGITEVIFEPVWAENYDTETYSVNYITEYNGEEIERPEWLKDLTATKGTVIEPDKTEIQIDGAYSRGWTDGEHTFGYAGEAYSFVMPDHDVNLTPIWFKVVTFTFYAGDVDRLNGNDTYSFNKNEASSTELAKSDRFSRNGFNLTGWLSSYDGEIYTPGKSVTVPDTDVTFTAVWTPKTYTVVFQQSNGEDIKIQGETDTAITCPEPTETVDGKIFAGWLFGDNTFLYNAGDDFVIPGAIPGQGISLSAVWIDKSEELTDTKPIDYGDANLDGNVTLADAVTVLQYIANSEKYPLTDEAVKNADCYNTGDGVTAMDALTIQQYDAGSVTSLPIKSE